MSNKDKMISGWHLDWNLNTTNLGFHLNERHVEEMMINVNAYSVLNFNNALQIIFYTNDIKFQIKYELPI